MPRLRLGLVCCGSPAVADAGWCGPWRMLAGAVCTWALAVLGVVVRWVSAGRPLYGEAAFVSSGSV